MQQNLAEEFDRQVENLIRKGYPKFAKLTKVKFKELLSPLKIQLKQISKTDLDLEYGTLPFAIVIKNELVDIEKAMFLTRYGNQNGVVKMSPSSPMDFKTVLTVQIPDNVAYLLVGIDRGKDTLNVRPEDALKTILSKNRSPLTIEEGMAVLTQYPDCLLKNNCFSLLASRIPESQQVPAIWINGQKQANLGWCWDRNPHTWIGSASCGNRLGF